MLEQMGVNTEELPPWATLILVFMLCMTGLAKAALRSTGPVAHAIADAMRRWFRSRS
jgi:hypothetical protein